MRSRVLFLAAPLLAGPTGARAGGLDGRVEGALAVPLSQPQTSRFGGGGSLAVELTLPVSAHARVGVRGRAGFLTDGPAPTDPGLADPRTGTLLAVGPTLRVGRAGDGREGPWLELAAGAALTGTLVRPVVEAGAGFGLRTAGITWSPALRFVEIVQLGGGLDARDARLGLLGVEIALGGRAPAAAPLLVAAPPRKVVAEPLEDDRDVLVDALGHEIEDDLVRNDWGSASADVQVAGDRLVLDERVLFDTDRARVKSTARPALRAVVALWRRHPEYGRLRIEGHTDLRGPDRYNVALSRERAGAVRDALVRLGVPLPSIDVEGRGAGTPRYPGHDAQALRRNRRVEFVILPAASALGQGQGGAGGGH